MGTNHGILELVDADFAEEVEQGQGVTVVDFWAPWCGPCRMVAPITEELAETYEGRVRFAKLIVDDAPETAARYGIRSIPTIGIFRDGEAVGGVVGVVPAARLGALIDEHLTTDYAEG